MLNVKFCAGLLLGLLSASVQGCDCFNRELGLSEGIFQGTTVTK